MESASHELGALLAGLDGSRQAVQSISLWVVAHPGLAAGSIRALRKATPRSPVGALWVLFVMHDVMAQIAGAGEAHSALWSALRFQLPAAVADAVLAGGDWTTVSRLIGAWRDAGHLGAQTVAMLEMAASAPQATPRPPSPTDHYAVASAHHAPQWGAAPQAFIAAVPPFNPAGWNAAYPASYAGLPPHGSTSQLAPQPQYPGAGFSQVAAGLPPAPGGYWQGQPAYPAAADAWSHPQQAQPQQHPQWAQQQWLPQPAAATVHAAPSAAEPTPSGSRWGAPPPAPAPSSSSSSGSGVSPALVALEAAKAAAAAAARAATPQATAAARFPVSAGLASSLRSGGGPGSSSSVSPLEVGPIGLLVAVMKAQAALAAAHTNAAAAAAAAAAAGDGSAAAAAALAASCAPAAAPRYGPVDAASVAAAAAAASKPPPVEPGRLAARLAEFSRAAARVLAEEDARSSAAAARGSSSGGWRRDASRSPEAEGPRGRRDRGSQNPSSAQAWPLGRGARSPSPGESAAGLGSRREDCVGGGDRAWARDAPLHQQHWVPSTVAPSVYSGDRSR